MYRSVHVRTTQAARSSPQGLVAPTRVQVFARTLDLWVDIFFIVREDEISNTVYLTTNEKFIITSINQLRAVDVRLIGYNELNSSNFTWTIDRGDIAQVVGNGARGQIFPVSEGDAVITVTHPRAYPFPLHINLRVTRDAVSQNAIFLTTQMNVMETVTGTSNNVFIQKIGGNQHNIMTNWTVDDPSSLPSQETPLTASLLQ